MTAQTIASKLYHSEELAGGTNSTSAKKTRSAPPGMDTQNSVSPFTRAMCFVTLYFGCSLRAGIVWVGRIVNWAPEPLSIGWYIRSR